MRRLFASSALLPLVSLVFTAALLSSGALAAERVVKNFLQHQVKVTDKTFSHAPTGVKLEFQVPVDWTWKLTETIDGLRWSHPSGSDGGYVFLGLRHASQFGVELPQETPSPDYLLRYVVAAKLFETWENDLKSKLQPPLRGYAFKPHDERSENGNWTATVIETRRFVEGRIAISDWSAYGVTYLFGAKSNYLILLESNMKLTGTPADAVSERDILTRALKIDGD